MKFIPRFHTIRLSNLEELGKIIKEDIDFYEKLIVYIESYRHIVVMTDIKKETGERAIPYEVTFSENSDDIFPIRMTADELDHHLKEMLSISEYNSEKVKEFLEEIRKPRGHKYDGDYITGIEISPTCTFGQIDPVPIFFKTRIIDYDEKCGITMYPRTRGWKERLMHYISLYLDGQIRGLHLYEKVVIL